MGVLRICHPEVVSAPKTWIRAGEQYQMTPPLQPNVRRVPLDLAGPVIQLLEPILIPDSFLFSLTRSEDGILQLYLEGKISSLTAIGS